MYRIYNNREYRTEYNRLEGNNVPVFILVGIDDRSKLLDSARLKMAIPSATEMYISDAVHTPQLEEPDSYAAAILKFLRARQLL